MGRRAARQGKNAVSCHIRNLREKLSQAAPGTSFNIRCVREVGYCFRPRLVKSVQGIFFVGFTPVVSVEAARSFREKVRETIRKSATSDIIILSQILNPVIRGWMNYFCKFAPSEAFKKGINYVNQKLVRWIRKFRKKAKLIPLPHGLDDCISINLIQLGLCVNPFGEIFEVF